MSLNQKYTWRNFLNENPEHVEKKTKRTSPEGKKAFEQAYKAFIKNYLSERGTKAEKLVARVKGKRDLLQTRAKDLRKSGKAIKAKIVDRKIAKVDSAIARIAKMGDKTKALQKSFK